MLNSRLPTVKYNEQKFAVCFLFVRKHAGIFLSWLGKPAFHSFILLAILQNGSRLHNRRGFKIHGTLSSVLTEKHKL